MKLLVDEHPTKRKVLQPCIFDHEQETKGVCIGSSACEKCRHHRGTGRDSHGQQWIKCAAVEGILNFINKNKYKEQEDVKGQKRKFTPRYKESGTR
jgi:hypothetical protein